MDIRVYPGRLSGSLPAISSKSDVHRALICGALADGPTAIRCNVFSKDIEATAVCLQAAGAQVQLLREQERIQVAPIGRDKGPAELFCGESGSTLRFLLPVMAALPKDCRFTGAGKLPERPIEVLCALLRQHGASLLGDALPVETKGGLKPGRFSLPGNISSQYITGLLLAFPLLSGPSSLHLTTKLQSEAYVDMTIDTMRRFGVRIRREGEDFYYEGEPYRTPGSYEADGDWSNAAFWLCADAMEGNRIQVTGLRQESLQGDRAVKAILQEQFGAEPKERIIDVSGIPDLLPVLSALSALSQGSTRFIHAERLRLKECDRLSAMTALIKALGGQVQEYPDGLLVEGRERLLGGVFVDGCNDHRIVMSAAVLASACQQPVVIRGAEAVEKSYPGFFEDFRKLGGRADVV